MCSQAHEHTNEYLKLVCEFLVDSKEKTNLIMNYYNNRNVIIKLSFFLLFASHSYK